MSPIARLQPRVERPGNEVSVRMPFRPEPGDSLENNMVVVASLPSIVSDSNYCVITLSPVDRELIAMSLGARLVYFVLCL